MKSLVQHIKEEFKFRINRDSAKYVYNYFPKTYAELKQIIKDHYDNKVYNLNDIDVSQIEDFSELFLNDPNTGNPQFDVSKWNVSNGINFRLMFYNCEKFNADLSHWNVSNGKVFTNMFDGCKNFNSNLSQWDVSNGIVFTNMFYGCKKFNYDLSHWDVSKGVYFSGMFEGCTNFNSDLSKWNVSKGIKFVGMFKNCPIKQEFKPKHEDIE